MKNTLKYFSIVSCSLLFMACANSNQLFPKKYLGNYHGNQDAYELTANGVTVKVLSSDYELVLDYGKLWLTTSQQKLAGEYEVVADTKMYYALKVTLENGITENWKLWKKGKRLIREAIQPESEVIFLKIK